MAINQNLLESVVVTLIPGSKEQESAHQIIDIAELLNDLVRLSALEKVEALLSALPADFSTLEVTVREATLRALEGTHSGFPSLLNAVYTLYYSNPRVLAEISRSTGYSSKPPQPEGYVMKPVDINFEFSQRSKRTLWRQSEINDLNI